MTSRTIKIKKRLKLLFKFLRNSPMNSFNLRNGLPLQKLDQPSFLKAQKCIFFRKATKKEYIQLALSKGD